VERAANGKKKNTEIIEFRRGSDREMGSNPRIP
jgi:hypothetical protein